MAATMPYAPDYLAKVIDLHKQAAAKHQEAARLAPKTVTAPIPSPEILPAELQDRWPEFVVCLPEHLIDLVNAGALGLDLVDTAEHLGISLLDLWDRSLEARAAIQFAAGVPVTNRFLEARLAACGMWPKEAKPFPGDVGALVRQLPARIRKGLYARLMCRNKDVEQVWGMYPSWFLTNWKTAARVLGYLAVGYGVLQPASDHTINGFFQALATASDAGKYEVWRSIYNAHKLYAPFRDPFRMQLDEIPAAWVAVRRAPFYQDRLNREV